MDYDRIKEIVEASFNKKLNHLINSLGNVKDKGRIHFKQKAIDKMERIRDEVLRDIKEEMENVQ